MVGFVEEHAVFQLRPSVTARLAVLEREVFAVGLFAGQEILGKPAEGITRIRVHMPALKV